MKQNEINIKLAEKTEQTSRREKWKTPEDVMNWWLQKGVQHD